MKKILISGLSELHGGVESFIYNYSANFDESVELHYIGPKNMVFQDVLTNQGGVIHILPSRRKNVFEYNKSVKKVFEQNNFDAVWVNACSLSDVSILAEASAQGVEKRIIHSHNSQQMGGLITKILHMYNKKKLGDFVTDYWACSPEAGEWMFNSMEKSLEVKVINNAINTEEYIFSESTRTLQREKMKWNDKFIVGHVGRFHDQKNHLFILEIFKEIIKLKPNALLVFVGSGDLMEAVIQKSKELEIFEYIQFLGQRSDVSKLMQGMDRFLLPSKYEGLPFVLVESQAASLPSLTSLNVVSSESKISSYLKFVDLKESPKSWAEKVVEFDLERQDLSSEIKKSGFDISIESAAVQKMLCK